ncbi:peroxiredoxin [Sphingomonas lutea]|uniref:thioredoxin-dependent peroxiredoxin n=1 Tax=Sphingomonas lutea TaxID=1045317 RepID=A0A7G9SID4_9SPHN|nr:peroxiredoxin [Sphingomonas lutea]QNN67609.1 peroxiredoxin [Sphingomonas lutea]
MRKLLILLPLSMLLSSAAWAALPVGAAAPNVVTTGAVGGKPFRLNLQQQLRKGPVVLYFFPKAFTEGCTLEARAFSEAMADFRKAGAQVIGMSTDDLPTLRKFSVEACRSAFPVATATPATVKAFDVEFKKRPGMTDRTTYVIDRRGRVTFVHSDLNYAEHVQKSLAAVRALKR